jgi:protein-S-isoprenylcysteine O-methyltransferase Ste14
LIKTIKHIQAILLLPFTVTIIIPSLIIYLTRSVNVGWTLRPPFNLGPPLLGLLLIGLGLALVLKTINLFATMGEGTLAPWDPTQKLVVQGIYRYVRNPMISGVFFILLGEAALLGSLPLLYWFAFFVLANIIYTPLFEERGLKHRFGQDYILYKQNVPRWIPRLSPWQSPSANSEDKGTGSKE